MTASTFDTCFVISPFGEPYDTYFSHIIKPALEDCKLYAVRGDSLYRPTTIMDDIWGGIQEAKILVAELTGRNPNVFYELGLAHALSKPVILVSQSIDDVPFDLRAIRVLVYDKDHPEWGALLRSNLTKAVNEVLQSPTTAIPSTFKSAVRVNTPEEKETLIRLEALETTVRSISSSFTNWDNIEQTISSEVNQSPVRLPKLLEVDDLVMHQKFGRGVVVEIDGTGVNRRARINFEHVGMKLMNLNMAKLTHVES